MAGAFSNAFSNAFDSGGGSHPLTPIVFSGCPCPCEDVCDCSECPTGYWTEYTFTVSGVSDNFGTCDCPSVYNGSFTVVYAGSCMWASTAMIANPDCNLDGVSGVPVWTMKRASAFFSIQNEDNSLFFDQTAATNCVDAFTVEGALESFGPCRINGDVTFTVTPGGSFITCP